MGQSYLAIEAGGIKIGTAGTIELEATKTVSVKGNEPTIKGTKELILQGGMVKIN